MASVAVDNDVIFKGVCYGLLPDLIEAMPPGNHVPGILGTAKFVLPKLLQRRPPHRAEEARAELQIALATMETLEPDMDEVALAAELEFEAQRQGLPVDSGECQLIAMLYSRNFHCLLTGDRRAIEGLANLGFPAPMRKDSLLGRIACLEQAVLRLLDKRAPREVRELVCAERDVDASLRACFSCASPEVGEHSWREGLESQIASTAALACGLLYPYPAQGQVRAAE